MKTITFAVAVFAARANAFWGDGHLIGKLVPILNLIVIELNSRQQSPSDS